MFVCSSQNWLTYNIMVWWKVKCVVLTQQRIVCVIFVLFYIISPIIVIIFNLQILDKKKTNKQYKQINVKVTRLILLLGC